MIAKYYWDFDIQDIEQKTKNKNLLEYFKVKSDKARKVISSVHQIPITELVAELNAIDEQLRLFFFYIFEEILVEQEDLIITIIEKEYRQTFLEEMKEPHNKNNSFLYFIDYSYSAKPIWELSSAEILKNEDDFYWGDYKIIREYYIYLRKLARRIINRLTPKNFNYQFPKLLLIDSKCRNFIDLIPFKDYFNFSEIEFILTIENEAKQYFMESFEFEDSGYSQYSLRKQISVRDN